MGNGARRIAALSDDETAFVWNRTTNRKTATIVHEDLVSDIRFSPDETVLATASYDRTVRVTGVDGVELVRIAHPERVTALAFDRTGRRLATATFNGEVTARTWKPEDVVARACRSLTRQLTRDEWRRYIGDEPYRPTCPAPARPR